MTAWWPRVLRVLDAPFVPAQVVFEHAELLHDDERNAAAGPLLAEATETVGRLRDVSVLSGLGRRLAGSGRAGRRRGEAVPAHHLADPGEVRRAAGARAEDLADLAEYAGPSRAGVAIARKVASTSPWFSNPWT